MAYEKTTWMTGDTITAEKMNKIEDQLEALSESSSGTNDITVTLDTANKKYLLGTTTQPAATATSMTIVADSNTYLDATGLRLKGSLTSGDGCVTDGANAHAEGRYTIAKGNYSHAEGSYTNALGEQAHAEGNGYLYNKQTISLTGAANSTVYTYQTFPFTINPTLNDVAYHYYIINDNQYYFITNIDTINTKITLTASLAQHGAIEEQLFDIYQAEGLAIGPSSHTEGDRVIAAGRAAHAEGNYTRAIGEASHAEGSNTKALGYYSHTEGSRTVASGMYSHAKGEATTASNYNSHAEGGQATAAGQYAHAEGLQTQALGHCSHSEGLNNIAKYESQHVFGEYNEIDPKTVADGEKPAGIRGTYIEIVGNGTADNDRKNARTLDWDGNEWLAGNLTLGQKLTFNNQETPYIHLETPGVAQLGICTDSIFLTRATPTESIDDGEEEIPVVNVDDPTNYGSFNFTFNDLAKLRILCDHYDQIMQLVNPPETNVEVTEPANP